MDFDRLAFEARLHAERAARRVFANVMTPAREATQATAPAPPSNGRYNDDDEWVPGWRFGMKLPAGLE